MSDTSGPMSGKQFATYDPDTQSWRMWPAIGLWGSIEFSETWPKTGYMRNGAAFELPTSAPATGANASSSSSLLPTPSATNPNDSEDLASLGVASGAPESAEQERERDGDATRGRGAEAVALLPTPRAMDGHGSMVAPAARQHVADGNGSLPEVLGVQLLPTPRATDGTKGGPNQRGSSGDLMPSGADVRRSAGAHGDGGLDLRTAVVQWGDYEPAIRRAELACGRPAPSPTEPNRNGNPRLSSRFAEWMMLLPDGHVTGVGLSRNEELKAIGNGVVPAQAFAALRILTPIAENRGVA